ncbi:MAG: helix-turn-helix transcriptional regulator [Thermosipho sp. (in: Bacteria)]|nr:helix-turn-helix transcriptional regulator [Thermosipho sp. (in: thermotogales)]
MGFPERLKELRLERGLLQKDIAEYLNITRPTIAHYENGTRKPDHETLERLASFFNVSIDYLLGRTNIRNEETMQNIVDAIKDNPELLDFWNQLVQREDLQLMFKQTKRLSPESIRKIIEVIKLIEDEEERES